MALFLCLCHFVSCKVALLPATASATSSIESVTDRMLACQVYLEAEMGCVVKGNSLAVLEH
jgi:hypothetical protein